MIGLKRQKKNRRNVVAIVVIAIAMSLCFAFCAMPASAKAAATTTTPKQYTDVLADLCLADNFNALDYPQISDDYSIKVIQIAESQDRELFVYTYQPANVAYKYRAYGINMSLSENSDTTQFYSISLVSQNGVFCKYVIAGVTVGSEAERFYNLSSIQRKFISGVDKKPDNDNTLESIAFNIGKLYRVTVENGKLVYECKDLDTIEILNPFAGHLEYSEGFHFFPTWCDAHFVAFSTKYQIDKLLKARVSFSNVVAYYWSTNPSHIDIEDESSRIVNNSRTVTASETGSNHADGWFGVKRTWNRIQSTSDFIAKNDLTDSAIRGLSGTQWVLNFAESGRMEFWGFYPVMMKGKYLPPTPNGAGNYLWVGYTKVYDVKVLSLTFESRGVVYNLGAVSNGVTGSKFASNNDTGPFNFLDWLIKNWKKILIGLLVIFALIILSPFMPLILNGISSALRVVWHVLVLFMQGVWCGVSAPFRLIKRLIDGKSGGS